MTRRSQFSSIFCYIILAGIVVYSITPFMWMLMSSFKTDSEILKFPPTWLPAQPTLSAYGEILTEGNFPIYYLNSVIVASSAAALSAIIGLMAGYGFSRFFFVGRGLLLTVFLASQMLPGVLLVGPYFKVLSFLHLYNTRIGLIIGLTTITLPFSTWMLKGYADSIPKDMDEAAKMDGCGKTGTLFRIILPSMAPGLVTTTLFAFLLAWGDLLWALCLTTTDSMYTIPVALARLVGEFRIQWAQIMAGSTIGLIPPVILYSLMSALLVKGLTKGAVK
ncbi:MAG: carbohydrate ABC transporter permease [Desulfobacteraceae bacterium]|nr:MAG: carbohydrate ABC transporter permease [Desulfobacteraceae bacterium]